MSNTNSPKRIEMLFIEEPDKFDIPTPDLVVVPVTKEDVEGWIALRQTLCESGLYAIEKSDDRCEFFTFEHEQVDSGFMQLKPRVRVTPSCVVFLGGAPQRHGDLWTTSLLPFNVLAEEFGLPDPTLGTQ